MIRNLKHSIVFILTIVVILSVVFISLAAAKPASQIEVNGTSVSAAVSINEIDMRSANKGNNGVWLSPGWVDRNSDLNKLLDHLSKNQMYRLYYNLGNIEPTNDKNDYKFIIHFNGTSITSATTDINLNDFKKLIDFKLAIKNYNPKFKLIAVICGGYNYNLLESTGSEKDELVKLVANIINYFNQDNLKVNGNYIFDGYQLDIEPISDVDNLGQIINVVKNKLGQAQFISVAIGGGDLRHLDDIVNLNLNKNDEIALMAYDYGLGSPIDYKSLVVEQVQKLTKTLSNKNIDASVYLPLYPANAIHNPSIENIKNSLEAIMIASKDDIVDKNFSRVIIYNYDELKDTPEWNQVFDDYKNLWLGGIYNVPSTTQVGESKEIKILSPELLP